MRQAGKGLSAPHARPLGPSFSPMLWGPTLGVVGTRGGNTATATLSDLEGGVGKGIWGGVVAAKRNLRGDAIWASVERAAPSRSRSRAPSVCAHSRALSAAPGIAAPRWGSVPAWLPRPGLPKVTGTRTVGHQAAAPGGGGAPLVQGSPLPQIGARARNGRAGAHGAAAPPDPGRGAPWEAGWEGPRRAPPAPPRGPRRFRSPRGRPGSQDEPPGLCVAGKSLFLSPHYRGQSLLPHSKLGLGDEAAIHRVGGSHFLLGKLRPGGVDALRLYPPCGSSGREP